MPPQAGIALQAATARHRRELTRLRNALGREICSAARQGESLRQARQTQRRLSWQMLSTWRAKPRDVEPIKPISGIVVALANSASRDNPLEDGPRATR
jgi:hypothetical protein